MTFEQTYAVGLGSSPRVRGKPDIPHSEVQALGLIPACAGKTGLRTLMHSDAQAHPRVCGENSRLARDIDIPLGSSPRVRGKLWAAGCSSGSWGLIPACAGKTTFVASLTRSRRAHPRVCGENPAAPGGFHCLRGSSPRVRGKPRGPPRRPGVRRLIPACAGKTLRDHECLGPGGGSSPRVRGKLRHRDRRPYRARLIPACAGKTQRAGRRARRLRLIPACAGKTSAFRSASPPLPAHPRVCGENEVGVKVTADLEGSSPRVRGKHRLRVVRVRRARLIPACAGKTPASPGARRHATAHPRVCGENSAT